MSDRGIAAIFAGLTVIGFMFQGFYREWGYLVSGVTLILIAAVYRSRWKRVLMQPFIALFLLLALVHAVGILHAVDREWAILEVLKMTGLLSVACLAALLPADGLRHWLSAWIWSGAAAVVIGVACGLYRGHRLESTFGYANVLAITLLIGMIAAALAYGRDRRPAHAAVVPILAAGLALAQSRAVWGLWGLTLVAAPALFPELRKPSVWLRLLAGHAAGWGLAVWIAPDPAAMWRRLTDIRQAVSDAAAPVSIWRDSLSILADYGWRGTGGGGWGVLQYEYQTVPYDAKHVYNHYLQVAIDAGYLGLFALLSLVDLYYAAVWQRTRRSASRSDEVFWLKAGAVVVTVALLHAAVDFTLNSFVLSALLYGIMAHAVSGVPAEPLRIPRPSLRFAMMAGIAAAGFMLWCGTAYWKMDRAERWIGRGELQRAAAELAVAGRMVPWSHSIRYERAMVLIDLAGKLNTRTYYDLADRE